MLRKIGVSIAVAHSTLGHEVRKQFQYDDPVGEAMKVILVTLRSEDVAAIAEEEDNEKGMFVDKVDELWGLAKGVCILAGVKKVLGMLEDAIDVPSTPYEAGESTDSEEAQEEDIVDGHLERQDVEEQLAPVAPVEKEPIEDTTAVKGNDVEGNDVTSPLHDDAENDHEEN
jgi:hypothetical protein